MRTPVKNQEKIVTLTILIYRTISHLRARIYNEILPSRNKKEKKKALPFATTWMK